MVQRRSKNEAKKATNHIGTREMTQDSGRWPKTAGDDPKQGYGVKLGVQNGGQNRTKIAKKTIRKSCFFYRPLDPKMEGKRVPKPAEMEAKMVQNRSQKRAQRKNEESMKTNNSPTFWLDFGCLRGWKIEEEIEKRVSKTIQNRRVILKRIFKGFLSILVPFWNSGWTENRKKRDQKQDRF